MVGQLRAAELVSPWLRHLCLPGHVVMSRQGPVQKEEFEPKPRLAKLSVFGFRTRVELV